MARKRFRALPKSSDYAAAEHQGQEAFDAIASRSKSDAEKAARQRAAPLLHSGSRDHKLMDEGSTTLQARALPPPPPSPKEPSEISAATEAAEVPPLATRQVLYIALSWTAAALITAIVIHRAEVTEVGTSAFKVTGLLRDVVLGYAGLFALAIAPFVLLASATWSRRLVWRLSYFMPKWLIRWPVTIAIVVFLQVPTGLSMLFAHQHVRVVTKDIYRSVQNAFTLPSDWTPIKPPPPLPIKKPTK